MRSSPMRRRAAAPRARRAQTRQAAPRAPPHLFACAEPLPEGELLKICARRSHERHLLGRQHTEQDHAPVIVQGGRHTSTRPGHDRDASSRSELMEPSLRTRDMVGC